MAEDIQTVAAHFDRHAISLRGNIDAIHAAAGIEGWAVDLARPAERLRLQCVVDLEVLAECETDRPREDVRQLARCHGSAGFRLPPDIFSAAARLLDTHGDRRMGVKVAGTLHHLPFAGTLPTIRELASLGQARQLEAPPNLEPPASQSRELAHPAAPLLAHPLRALSENLQGRIELMSTDVAGEVWICGWMKKGHPLKFAAVLHDGEKHPATVEFVGYDRGDLPAGNIALFGTIRTEWTASVGAEDLFLFFGDEGRFHLRWNRPLQHRSIDELLRLFEEIRPRCYAGRAADMLRAIASVSNWSPRLAQVAGFAADAHVDRMLIVPHFGVFVEGWVLSPVKTVDHLMLRIGGRVLPLDSNSLYRKRRADLAASFEGPDEFLDRRGFVATFRGDIAAELVTDPALKVVFTDGTSINHAVDARLVRRLGHSAAIRDVLPFYPNIQSEPFFGEFATAVGQAIRDRMARYRPYKVATAQRAVVIALPNSRADTYLLFDELLRRLARKWQPQGFAFILGDNERRTDVIPLFEEFAPACPCPCSLLIVPNIDYALYTLPDVLRSIGAVRFVYFGPNVFASDTGWRAATRFLSQDSDSLVFFGVDEEPDGQPSRTRTADCFGWTTTDFATWIVDSPAMVGGFDAGLVMPWTGARAQFRRGGAWRTRSRHFDRLGSLVNQEALRRHRLVSDGRE
jgi:hypothetical protein